MIAPLTATAAAQEIAAGRLSPEMLVADCLNRIEQLEPELKAWVEIDAKSALQAAELCQAELSSGQQRGPLAGIPVAIKDIVDVAGFPTRCGSPLTSEEPVTEDAPLIAQLRTAGAIILGKTVTTEYACFDPPITKNPWNAERTPGGSSSGSAAAVAAGMVPLAIGSQTGGSVTRPASYCGVASCKPTFARINRTGVYPVSEHLDHVGVFARCVADLAMLLNAVQEPFCDVIPIDFDLEQALPRLQVVGPYFLDEAEEQTRTVILNCISRLGESGAELAKVAMPESFSEVHMMHRRIMAVETSQVHKAQFAQSPERYGPCIASLIREGLATPAHEYQAALHHQRAFTSEMIASMSAGTILLTPATPAAAPDCSTTGDPRFNSPWSYCGLPTVSFPCGVDSEGMPVSIQLIAAPWREAELLQVAAWCERILDFQAIPPLLK